MTVFVRNLGGMAVERQHREANIKLILWHENVVEKKASRAGGIVPVNISRAAGRRYESCEALRASWPWLYGYVESNWREGGARRGNDGHFYKISSRPVDEGAK